jgi:hypothetical protein
LRIYAPVDGKMPEKEEPETAENREGKREPCGPAGRCGHEGEREI